LRLQQIRLALQDDSLWLESGAPPDSLWRRRIVEGARKCIRRIRDGQFAQLHALRIRSKRCRYTLEALGSAAPRRRLAAMTEIHRALGDYFDVCVAAQWLAGADPALPADCRRKLQTVARDDVRSQLRRVTKLLRSV
jgi:CHAD domain-containing protein